MLKKIKEIFDISNKEYNTAIKIAKEIDALAEEYQVMSDEELQEMTPILKTRLENGETLDDVLVAAYATAREASKRVSDKYPYFVQLVGAVVLHRGNIAEMRTGEGKTLTSVLPAYLNSLENKGVHIVTVNEYLATREAEGEIGDIFRFLGLSVGLNLRDLNKNQKREVYDCDIVYSTNSEIGFDYLRDNMVLYKTQRVMQRGLNYAIIDEIDSALIDEARTPLIISGGKSRAQNLYEVTNNFARSITEEDYDFDVKTRVIGLTQAGISKAEKSFNIDNLYDLQHAQLVHAIAQALKANYTLEKEVDYVVHEGEVVIVDQFTGRMMPGRAYSDGLHQALEAKEGLKVKEETSTVATITYQNLFRMYKKLSGMTGTAKTEEEEFREIYNMYVVVIPTNVAVIRNDNTDIIYGKLDDKFKAITAKVKELNEKGQPVLVGTVAVETSEYLSKLFTKSKIKHEVLNAKNHFREADIIKNAGQKYAVTIATNMAGRGTDIKLGEGVVELGGLYVIGTERHESRRIDNQLRGRSGRQGDPGTSQFYVSFEDTLMIRFGMSNMQKRISSDEPLQSRMFTKAFEGAQKRIEGNNYDIRKRLLQYDDVMGKQREVMYKMRNDILDVEDYHQTMMELIERGVEVILDDRIQERAYSQEVHQDIVEYINAHYTDDSTNITLNSYDSIEDLKQDVTRRLCHLYEEKLGIVDEEARKEFEKVIALRVIDTRWMSHIDAMAHLKEGVGMRGYAQENPLRAYTMEGLKMFDEMIYNIERDIVQFALRSKIKINEERKEVIKGNAVRNAAKEQKRRPTIKTKKIRPNEPCPCGSGKKYKHCCGRN